MLELSLKRLGEINQELILCNTNVTINYRWQEFAKNITGID